MISSYKSPPGKSQSLEFFLVFTENSSEVGDNSNGTVLSKSAPNSSIHTTPRYSSFGRSRIDYAASAPKTPSGESRYSGTDQYKQQSAMPSSSLFVRESPRDPLPSSTTKSISSRSAFLQSLQERERERSSNTYNYSNQSSPTEYKRRQLSPKKSVVEVKPVSTSTPSNQSKLASHAFTLSRSSTEGEENHHASLPTQGTSAFIPRKFEPTIAGSSVFDTVTKREFDHFDSVIRNLKDRDDPSKVAEDDKTARETRDLNKRELAAAASISTLQAPSLDLSKIEQAVSVHLTQLSTTLRNDLQNLHVEMIKQSLAQQTALRSLFETYLPMTSQLMDALTAARDENERLKLKLEELRSYRS